MARSRRRFERGAALGLACLGVLLAFEWLWLAPERRALADKRQQLEQQRLGVDRGRRAAGGLPALASSIEALEARLAQSGRRLPAERDAAVLLRRLEAAAARSGLAIRAFAPQPPVDRAWFTEWPIHLEVSGTYQRLGLFFERVSRFERIINMRDVTIRTLDPPRPNETIAAECTAVAFVRAGPAPAGDDAEAGRGAEAWP